MIAMWYEKKIIFSLLGEIGCLFSKMIVSVWVEKSSDVQGRYHGGGLIGRRRGSREGGGGVLVNWEKGKKKEQKVSAGVEIDF